MAIDLKQSFSEPALGVPDFTDGTWRMQNKAGDLINSMAFSTAHAAELAPGKNPGHEPKLKF